MPPQAPAAVCLTGFQHDPGLCAAWAEQLSAVFVALHGSQNEKIIRVCSNIFLLLIIIIIIIIIITIILIINRSIAYESLQQK